MSELLFVLKCFAFTAVLVVFMQLKIGSATIENHSYEWLQKSSVSRYVQSVAAGGVMAIRSLGSSVKGGFANATNGFSEGSAEQARR